ncbi:O phosphoseryl tRNA(Sec) selenium transferase [Trichuris trichiura]|uniref:O-phosphoseryl-tRNA(Sec) selenium transferase n=1 Tax=Trichuris trichiura TaxID=36087 RepID=A0A077ZIW7_TRITR|nr:O phosphoseryl tRNA(Sec) selenium transferase [Trichuris trichiura]
MNFCSLMHGIGRSGDIAEMQPKALGSSLINKLSNSLALHAIQLSGIRSCVGCRIFPVATGMALALCLTFLRKLRPSATRIVWSRIDQRTCVKCMTFTGLEVVVVEQKPSANGDQYLETDLAGIRTAISNSPQEVLCVISTTSCFAPRSPDKVVQIAQLCSDFGVPHLINNAYGLQSEKICNDIEQASLRGRVDLFVQSCDKNFMVPVGGAIVGAFSADIIDGISRIYPGRASADPSIDLLITLLSMGTSGYLSLIKERTTKCYPALRDSIARWASEIGETVLSSPANPISIAVSLRNLDALCNDRPSNVCALGSMLFSRNISGARVVPKEANAIIDGLSFQCWGSHTSPPTCSYLVVAAAIGMKQDDVPMFLNVLSDAYWKFRAKYGRPVQDFEVNEESMMCEPNPDGSLLIHWSTSGFGKTKSRKRNAIRLTFRVRMSECTSDKVRYRIQTFQGAFGELNHNLQCKFYDPADSHAQWGDKFVCMKLECSSGEAGIPSVVQEELK